MDRAFGLDVPRGLDEACHPDRTALIVYDMQVGIVSQVADGRSVAERVGRVLQAARQGGFRVFFIRHMSLPSEAAGVSQLRRARAWQKADLGYVPIVATDACGFGNAEAAERARATLAFAGEAILAESGGVTEAFRRFQTR